LPFDLGVKYDSLKCGEALALFQATGVEINEEIQKLIEGAMEEKEVHARPGTDTCNNIPILRMNWTIL
jgi:hypothetical protein